MPITTTGSMGRTEVVLLVLHEPLMGLTVCFKQCLVTTSAGCPLVTSSRPMGGCATTSEISMTKSFWKRELVAKQTPAGQQSVRCRTLRMFELIPEQCVR